MTKKCALVWGFSVLWCAAAALAAPASPRARKAKNARVLVENDRDYAEGVALYARGDLPRALADFKKARRRHPGDRTVQAAIARAHADLIASAIKRSPPPPEDPTFMDSFDAVFTDDLPQFVAFDETLGGADNAQGTLGAYQGRIAQLLAEQKVARAHHRPFGKADELRALARRLPAVVA